VEVRSMMRVATGLVAFSLLAFSQETMRNDDVIKLKAGGMSDQFILDMIKEKPCAYELDAGRMIALKKAGISEEIMRAMGKKCPPKEDFNSDSIVRLAQAGFSDELLINIVKKYPAQFATDTGKVLELKQAGVSEKVIAAMVGRTGGDKLPMGTKVTVRMIDSIDSTKAKEGDTFRASLAEPLMLAGEQIAPKDADALIKLVAEKESGKFTGTTQLGLELVGIQIRNKMVDVSSETLTRESGGRGKKTATRSIIMSGVGALIGGIAGGGSGAAIGAAAGAGAGAGSQVLTKGEKVFVPSETVLNFELVQPVSI